MEIKLRNKRRGLNVVQIKSIKIPGKKIKVTWWAYKGKKEMERC